MTFSHTGTAQTHLELLQAVIVAQLNTTCWALPVALDVILAWFIVKVLTASTWLKALMCYSVDSVRC